MKYLVSCLLALSLLSSCTVIEEQYYEPGYYPPPPPRVEVHPIQPPRQFNNYHGHSQDNNGYRPAPGRRVYQGHANTGGRPVVVNPRPAQAQAGVPQNVHGHHSNNVPNNVHVHPNTNNVHGHTNNKGTVHGHGGNTGGAVVIKKPQARTAPTHTQPHAAGHDVQAPVAVQPSAGSDENGQVTVHGHS